jgi:putative sterol carrier protein
MSEARTQKTELSRGRFIFLAAAPFPALVFFKFWAAAGRDPTSLLAAASAMLVYCGLVIVVASRWDRPSYFDWAACAYFLVVALSLKRWPEWAGAFFTDYAVTGIYACLFAAAFIPPLVGLDPFTYHYAKKLTPREAWENPIFVKINRIMTHVWSTLFAACILLSLYPSVITRAAIPVALIACLGLPFNLRFPDYYLKKMGLPSLAEQRSMALRGTPADHLVSTGRLPESAREAISGMPEVFRSEAAGDLSAVIRFRISEPEDLDLYLQIEKGACRVTDQAPRAPDLTIHSPADVWLAISRRELDGQRAFMEQKFTAEGDLSLLMQMNRLFGR